MFYISRITTKIVWIRKGFLDKKKKNTYIQNIPAFPKYYLPRKPPTQNPPNTYDHTKMGDKTMSSGGYRLGTVCSKALGGIIFRAQRIIHTHRLLELNTHLKYLIY